MCRSFFFIGQWILINLILAACSNSISDKVSSPDGELVFKIELTENGEPFYNVSYKKTPVIQHSPLGIVRNDADFTQGLSLYALSHI
jgi:hypothetical protein